MAVNPIPPQAYTKDTMLRAYSWLQNQSLHIREMATTPDILVSLYLKTTRDGEGALDRPSIQNFKNELRSLAGLMGELESAPTESLKNQQAPIASSSSHSPSSQPSAFSIGSSSSPSASSSTSLSSSTLSQNSTLSQSSATLPPSSQSQPFSTPISTAPLPPVEPSVPSQSSNFDLDLPSLEMIREVKVQLNLSNDTEALRAIVRLGHLQVTRLFR